MTPEEIKKKLQELVDSAGDNPSDALLPAALLQLIKANEDNAEKIAKINEQMESVGSIASKASEQAKQDRENSARNEKIAIGVGAFIVILLLIFR